MIGDVPVLVIIVIFVSFILAIVVALTSSDDKQPVYHCVNTYNYTHIHNYIYIYILTYIYLHLHYALHTLRNAYIHTYNYNSV